MSACRAPVLPAVLGAITLSMPLAAQAPPASATSQSSSLRWSIVNTTRVESWGFFEPPPAGGDPDYAFVANRLRLALAGWWRRVELTGSLQYVQFGGLPSEAIGPGPLGTGALYFDHAGRRDGRGLYLRTLFARSQLPGGVVVQGGRFPYQSGGEAPSGQPKVDAVKRARLEGRLIGEFEWSIYQRTFDGVRIDLDRPDWHLSGSWFRPTQGGFEERAGGHMSGVDVGSFGFTMRPSVALPATELSVFVMHYDDERPVAARPDNTGISAARTDVGIRTFGAAAVGSASAGPGEIDWFAWVAGQSGSWYGQRHRAWSLALEGGYQWQARWQPWVRGGFLHASGDGNSRDDRHGTFFPLLPTVRKYAFTTAYAPMNLQDAFVEVMARPTARVGVRFDARALWLAAEQDLWYGGSGATQQRGSIFGYAGRRSGGSRQLGTVFEGSADVAVSRHWSVNGFLGAIRGGPVVRSSFRGTWLRFAYLESVIQF